jgi:hypothetical protein
LFWLSVAKSQTTPKPRATLGTRTHRVGVQGKPSGLLPGVWAAAFTPEAVSSLTCLLPGLDQLLQWQTQTQLFVTRPPPVASRAQCSQDQWDSNLGAQD